MLKSWSIIPKAFIELPETFGSKYSILIQDYLEYS